MPKIICYFSFIFYSFSALSQKSEHWVSLFNGVDLKNWDIVDKPVNVKVADSSIVIHMTPYTSRHAFIRTQKKYKNFIFEIDFRRDLEIDSGILFRGINAPDTAWNALFGYMVKIFPIVPTTTRFWTGGIMCDYGNGFEWLYDLANNEKALHAEKPKNEWNKVRIEAIENNIKVWLNGISTVNLIDDRYKNKGYIAFKVHFLMAEKERAAYEIAYKNPKIITKNLKKYTWKTNLPEKNTIGFSGIKYFR